MLFSSARTTENPVEHISSLRCWGIIAISTVKQTEGASLDAQRDAIERYAQNHGLHVKEWFEEKETAAKQGRPLFTHMVKALKKGQAQGVIMHKIDRSARNFRDWATIGELHDSGVEVHFANEYVDFNSRGGRLSADIQAVFAADYIRNLKEEIAKGQKSRLEQGLYPFTAPMGYLNCGKGKPKEIDPITGPYIKLVFDLYATGQYSLISLEDELYTQGVRTKQGSKVYRSKLETILADPFYMGVIKIKKTGASYQGIHQPLISPELFKTVQAIKKQKSRRTRTKHNHLFRGLFHCAHCHNSMIPERQRSHVYYRCHTRNCPPNCINGKAIEESIVTTLMQHTIDPKQVTDFTDRLSQWLLELSSVPHMDTQAQELEHITHSKDRLTVALMNGTIDEETYTRGCAQLVFRKTELSHMIHNQRTQQEKVEHAGQFLEQVKNLVNTWFLANDHEKRQLVELCFSNRAITDKKVELSTHNWLVEAVNQVDVLLGADHRGETRRMLTLGLHDIKGTIDKLNCPEARQLRHLCGGITKPKSHSHISATPNESIYPNNDV